MSAYLFVKQLHVACVALSLAGFAARGLLKRGRTLRLRATAFAAALLAAAYAVSVALARDPRGFLAGLS